MHGKKNDPWVPLRTESAGSGKENDLAPPLPGRRGRYLLYLGPPVIKPIDGRGRYIHFSWAESRSGQISYAVRDFIGGMERREGDDLTAEQIWRRALDRIPAVGDYYRPYTEGKFWRETLEKLTAAYHSNKTERS